MTEIEKLVERLREPIEVETPARGHWGENCMGQSVWYPLMEKRVDPLREEAADEIERLLAALKSAEGERDRIGALYDQEDKKAAADIARLEAERDAAVAAERGRCLRIAEFYERHNGDDDAWEMCAQYIARDISGGQEPLTDVEAADQARATLASNSGGG